MEEDSCFIMSIRHFIAQRMSRSLESHRTAAFLSRPPYQCPILILMKRYCSRRLCVLLLRAVTADLRCAIFNNNDFAPDDPDVLRWKPRARGKIDVDSPL